MYIIIVVEINGVLLIRIIKHNRVLIEINEVLRWGKFNDNISFSYYATFVANVYL